MAQRGFWPLVLVAAAILMVTMGTRQSMGLFLSPLNTHTGLGIASISFAMAIAQLVWGVAQPVFGAVAGRVIVIGAVMLAAGSALTTQVTSEWGLIFALGLLRAAGAGGGQLFHPDRRDCTAHSDGAPLVRGRGHQRGRQYGAVHLRPAEPGRHVGLWRDERHVDDGRVGLDHGADGLVAARHSSQLGRDGGG